MYIKTILILVLAVSFSGCDTFLGNKIADIKLRQKLIGDWERIIEEDSSETELPALSFIKPDGMTISNDSIEFYLGFFEEVLDSVTNRTRLLYLGNKTPYKTNQDSIFIRDPLTGNRRFKWKFTELKNDTLSLVSYDEVVFKYKRRTLNAVGDFDQIIYSSSGCYGTCPIMDVSIDREGNMLFQGEGYVMPLGFYSAKLNSTMNDYLFNKFREAQPLALKDYYEVDHTDDQTITTTFVKNGKIVKTVFDYGVVATKEMIWAYIPISYLHSRVSLTAITKDKPFYPKLFYFVFDKGDVSLGLAKSESFFLWTELKKAKKTTQKFTPTFDLTMRHNYDYWGPDPNEERVDEYTLKTIRTDGQFFQFDFEEGKSITYDLGYNFIERNYDQINSKERE